MLLLKQGVPRLTLADQPSVVSLRVLKTKAHQRLGNKRQESYVQTEDETLNSSQFCTGFLPLSRMR